MSSSSSSTSSSTESTPAPLICSKPGCGKQSTIKCSRCLDASYCSEECLKEHFEKHKETCVQTEGNEIILNKSQMEKLQKVEELRKDLQKNFQLGENTKVIDASFKILELLTDLPPPIKLGDGIQVRMNLSTALLRAKRIDEAVEQANIVVNEAKLAVELRKGHPQAIEVMAIALTIHVSANIAKGELDTALDSALLSNKMAESIYPKNDLRFFRFLRPLANVYEQKGDLAEAEKILVKAYTMASIAKGPQAMESLIVTDELVSMFMSKKDSASALKHAIKNYTNIKEKANLSEEEKLILADASSRISSIYAMEGKFAEAEPYVKHTLELRENSKVSPPQPLGIGYALSQYVAVEEGLKKLSQDSVKKLEKAIDIFAKVSGQHSPDFIKCNIQLRKVKKILDPSSSEVEVESKAKPITEKFGYVDMNYQITILREKSRVTESELKLIQSFKPDDGSGRMMAANNFFETGKMVVAEALISDAYKIFLSKHGADHPATKASLQNLLATKKHRLDQIWLEVTTEEILEMEEKDKLKSEQPEEEEQKKDELSAEETAFINSLTSSQPPSGGCVIC